MWIVPKPASETWQACVSRMTLVHECACDRAGAGIEIFVGTPDSKIDIPIVKRERDVADRVRKIEPRDDSVLVRCRGDLFDVEQLTGEKVRTAKYDYRQLIGIFVDEIENVFCADCEFAFARSREKERIFLVEAVMNDLRFDG